MPEQAKTSIPSSVDLGDIVLVLWRWRLGVALFALMGGAIAFGTSYLMVPQYRAQTTVMAVVGDAASGGGVAQLVRGLGGLASLAGLGVGGGSSRDEIVEYVRSRSFTTSFIQDENLLPILFPDDWDAAKGQWRVPANEVPSLGDGYRLFVEDVRAITDDKKSGLIRLSITWSDRALAAKWANGMIQRANAQLRARAIQESEKSIRFLQLERTKTNVVSVEEAIARLTEEQIKSVMLANVREQFALKVIDPAAVPDLRERVSPRRMLLLALGLFVGAVLGAIAALVRSRVRRG